MLAIAETVQVLGGQRVLGRPIKTMSDLRAAVSHGLSPKAAEAVVTRFEHAGHGVVTIQRLVPASSWKRRLAAGRLSAAESARVERLARCFALARMVLGSDEYAVAFFTTPHSELDNLKPLDIALEELGARQVEEILWGIYFGIPA